MHVTTRRLLALAVLLAAPAGAFAAQPQTETIVLVRHGEKPAQGLGQLTCQGLNRALALPLVIGRLFGRPDMVIAPDPAVQKDDLGKLYDYVRPLATIEPTAIAFGLPIHAGLGLSDVAGLRQALEAPAVRGALVVVAWEHYFIVKLVREMLAAHGGDPAVVPEWQGSDFDSIDVLRVSWTAEGATAVFERRNEDLNGQPTTCPGAP